MEALMLIAGKTAGMLCVIIRILLAMSILPGLETALLGPGQAGYRYSWRGWRLGIAGAAGMAYLTEEYDAL
jgi:hypothetical protein